MFCAPDRHATASPLLDGLRRQMNGARARNVTSSPLPDILETRYRFGEARRPPLTLSAVIRRFGERFTCRDHGGVRMQKSLRFVSGGFSNFGCGDRI
ncbi:hypothetical protein CHELA40_10001 [Chelatococcus asaccharovorans]|nr:hypothetical protein CHELA40_10001 [Chelatococcus asaccharovorans]